MISRMTIVRGLQRGLRVTWELSKVVIPVIFIVTALKYTPVLPWISQVMAGSADTPIAGVTSRSWRGWPCS